MILVGEDGQVENRVLTLPPGVPSSALTEAGNFLNARIRGRTLAEARLELETALGESPRRARPTDAEGDLGRHCELVRRREARTAS